MASYKIEQKDFETENIQEWYIYKRTYVFFGLIPTGWELELCTQNIKELETWIRNNMKKDKDNE